MDPLRRLSRHVIGASLLDEGALVVRTMSRLEVEPRPSLIPERNRAVRSGARRNAARTASPAPNAPQLFRLVRHPFALAVVRPVRGKSGVVERVVRERKTLEQLSARVRVTKPPSREPVVVVGARSPTRPPRLSAETWLAGSGR